jgi:glycosyltransferase involved in cell wall biosynthesis
MDRLVARHTIDEILAHTQFQKKFYQGMGIGEERISIIPHCVDSSRIEAMASGDICPRTDDKPRIFYAGRLQASKGIVELLSSFHVLSRRIPSTLVIVGDGPLKEWVSEKRKALERENNGSKIVFLDGWRPPRDFMPHMAQADVVVLPSHSEMCPIILLEAMALGKAIVATDVGGIPEIIRDSSSGLLVKQRDEKQLARALSKLAVDSTLRQRLGLNALRTIREEYDVTVVAPKFLRFMERDLQ